MLLYQPPCSSFQTAAFCPIIFFANYGNLASLMQLCTPHYAFDGKTFGATGNWDPASCAALIDRTTKMSLKCGQQRLHLVPAQRKATSVSALGGSTAASSEESCYHRRQRGIILVRDPSLLNSEAITLRDQRSRSHRSAYRTSRNPETAEETHGSLIQRSLESLMQ